MKKLLPLVLVLTLVAGVPGAWAKNSFSGKSFGSSGFKSIQQLKTTPKAPTSSPTLSGSSLPTTRQSSMPMFSPPLFFWIPIGGGPMPAGAGTGWLLVIVAGAVILFLFFRGRRVPADGDPEQAEGQELEMFYRRCQKNLDHLAVTYVEAQTWLERLEGKIPSAQWRDWNDKFTRVSIDDFTKQLKEIRQDLDQGRLVAARTALFSFDEDATEVFEFFREMENTLEDVG